MKSFFRNSQLIKINFFSILFICAVINFSCNRTKPADEKIHIDNPIIQKATALFNSNQQDRSIAYLDSAYVSLRNPGTFDTWSKYNFESFYYLKDRQKPLRAMLCIDSMMDILKGKELEFAREYVHTLMADGDALTAEGKYEDAFQAYYNGSLFAQQHLDICSSYELTNRLGMARYYQGDYLKAIPYIKKAMIENSDCKGMTGDVQQIADVQQGGLNTIALCFEKSGQLDSAVDYYKKALTYINEHVNLFSLKGKYAEMASGVVYGNLGGTYRDQKKYDLAEKYLKASIKINGRQGYYQEDAKTAQLKLAALYLKLSRFNQADFVLQQIVADRTDWQKKDIFPADLQLKWLQLKWEYFDGIHDLANAYRFSQRYYFVSDSSTKAGKNQARVALDDGLKEIEQHYKLALLSKGDELKTVYLSAIIVFSLLILIILLMAWYNLTQSRKKVGELTILNQVISVYNFQMQNALTALEQSYEENANMMRIVAHDLRAPIGGITIAASRMLDKPNLPENDLSMLRLIESSGKDSLALVGDMLKTHAGAKELKKEIVDMYSLLDHCVTFMRLKAQEKGQQIYLDAGRFTVYADRGKMWRVVSNLVTNSIKFSPTGTAIAVSMLKKEGTVLISVDDCGIGIPEGMGDKVFDLFTEAKRPGTTGEQPYGIGLAICKQIVEMHGGEIWFENKPTGGTIFNVTLPM